MDNKLYIIKELANFTNNALSNTAKQDALVALESGKVLFFPEHAYMLSPEESSLLNPNLYAPTHKNISFDHKFLSGLSSNTCAALKLRLQKLMQNYAKFAQSLAITVLNKYQEHLILGRTSYRPIEIHGRIYSKRKDDRRLHIDSFPATPVYGRRILRVFCNINPYGKPRTWHVGEAFIKILARFANDLPSYSKLRAKIMHGLKITKMLRSPYDHYQLKLHDYMKLNDAYQADVDKQRIDFPAQSTWLAFTDQVSHAALGGQFLLEQTFYLPVEAMANPLLSPLLAWRQYKSTQLI